MAWLVLFFAGVFEIAWAISMKYSDGFSKWIPSLITLVCMCLSFMLLSYSMKTIPLGTAYAVWVGIGSVGVAAISMIFLGETASVYKLVSLFLVVIGIVGLKVFSSVS